MGIKWYTESLLGPAVCRGKGCPLRSGRLFATLGVDRTEPFDPVVDGFPHGIMTLAGQWGRRCAIAGTTQPDPSTRPPGDLGELVFATISAEFTCEGAPAAIPFVFSRVR